MKRRFQFGALLLLALVGVLWGAHFKQVDSTSFEDAPDVAWANPLEKSLHNTGPVTLTGEERRYDCTQLTYRLIDDPTKKMRPGCFVPTSFGMLDPGLSLVIFNGTDEAQQIRYGGSAAALSVVPYSGSVARFGSLPGLGSYMYLYTDFYDSLEAGGTIVSGRHKVINTLPNYTVTDPQGNPLPVNTLALSYSARGQWMVTESPAKSLVRVNMATFSVLPFDKSFFAPASPYASHTASMAITESGRYAAVASKEYKSFKVYDLKTCAVVSATEPLVPQQCQSHDYWSYLQTQVAGNLLRITQVQFVHDGLISFQAETSSGTESYLLSPSGSITSLIPFLGLGDSYASGQGAFNYRNGTDTAVNQCHLSVRSYPLLLNGSKFGSRGQSVACSGGRIHDVGSKSPDYTGQASDQRKAKDRQADGSEVAILHDYLPGYMAQQSFVTTYQPGVMTVQIGGNDVGFGQILMRCLSPLASLKNPSLNPNSCYQSYEDRLEIVQTVDRTYGRWVQLYKQLRNQSPKSRIYALGYPHILSANAQCRANVRLTLAEIAFARDLTNYINGVIQKASRAAGVHYIDISNALQGRELCSGSPGELAVNGLTAGTDAVGLLGQESFHPNALGHQLIEQVILSATDNFSSPPNPSAQPTEPTPKAADSEPTLQAPRSGRSVNTVIPQQDLVRGNTSSLGGVISVTINGTTVNLKPNTNYSVRLGDSVIAQVQSNAQGEIQVTVTIPTNLNGGLQPVTVTGPDQNNNPVTVVEVIYVHDSPTDYDGDGIPNVQDSCPLVANSGQDEDQDGIDDACDSILATPITPEPLPLEPTESEPPPSPQPTNVSPAPATSDPHGASTQSISALAVVNSQQFGSNLSVITTPSSKPLSAAGGRAAVKGASTLKMRSATKPEPSKINQNPHKVYAELPNFMWHLWLLVFLGLAIISRLARRLAYA